LQARGQARPEPAAGIGVATDDRSFGMETYDPHKSTTESRQGDRRMMSMRVLVFSVIGILIVFAILYVVFTMNTPPTAQ
jgi:hypothetical protein